MNREEAAIFATKYVEDVLSFFGVNVAVRASIDEDVLELSVPSTPINSLLIGKESANLRALQTLVVSALIHKSAELTRVNIDIADYKRQRADRIATQAEKWIEQVRKTGQAKTVDLNAADRRTVHKVASDYSDITTHSEGEGRERRIIISKTE